MGTPASKPPPAQQELAALAELYQQRQFADMEPRARALTERLPKHGLAWKMLGASLHGLGRKADALVALRQAARLIAGDPEVHSVAGALAKDLGLMDDAIASYCTALALAPGWAALHNNLGNVYGAVKRLDEAQACYEQALALQPGYALAHANLAGVLKDKGQLEAALASCQQALQSEPMLVQAHGMLGVVLSKLSRLPEALHHTRLALQLTPDNAELHANLGAILNDLGRPAEAVPVLQEALRLRPDYDSANNNLGKAWVMLGRFAAALESCERALRAHPDYAEALNNAGVALQGLKRTQEAQDCFERALQVNPDYVEAHSNLGNLLGDLGDFDGAHASFERALHIDPKLVEAYDNLLFTLNYAPDKSAEEIFAAYRAYDQQYGLPHRAAWQPHAARPLDGRRLRVGYVSPDFRQHSCRHFLEPLLAAHDRSAFEIFAYAELTQEDAYSARYRQLVEHWVPTKGLTDDTLAQRIRDDGIDVLVDLAGHTRDNRLLVFARKPAPVSVSWLGFGYTTGLSAVDYFLTDEATLPPEHEAYFSEAPWRLPRPAFAYRPAPGMGEVGPLPALATGQVTFGSLTRSVRINHRTVRVWAQILHRLPLARLVVDSVDFQSAQACRLLQARFGQHGIAAERLQIGCHSPPWDLLRGMDIGLDCFPHNSGTTLFESLYMGVPFITLASRPGVGRLGGAILHGVGQPQWSADSEAQYVELAVQLAGDLPRLALIRQGLRQRLLDSPLMDEVGFARAVETAYLTMLRHVTGIPAPSDIHRLANDAAPATPARAVEHLAALFTQQRLDEARQWGEQLVAAHPGNGVAWKLLGAVARQQGDPERALACLHQAVSVLPQDAEAHCNLANVQRAAGQLEPALHGYQQALRLDPDFHPALVNLGNLLAEHGKAAQAELLYQQALRLQPDNALVCCNLGVMLRQLGRLADSEVQCRKAVALMPEFANAHLNLGVTLGELDRLEEALACQQQVLRLQPQNAEALNNMGNLLKRQQRLEQAVACYQEALRWRPGFAQAHNNLGVAWHEMGLLAQAEASYRQALDIKPDYVSAHSNLGASLRELGRLSEAESHHLRALALDPNYAPGYSNLGIVLRDQGRLEEAMARFQQALALQPHYAEALNNLGITQHELCLFTDAEQSYRRALQLNPRYADAYSNLGSTLKEFGRFDEAEQCFHAALQADPQVANAFHNLLFALNYAPNKSAEEIFAAYRAYDQQYGLPHRAAWQPHAARPLDGRRLRVGYVSPDFRQHSCRHFLEPLLAAHDRSAFEIFAYAELTQEDAYSARYRQLVEHWVPTKGLTDDTLAQRIRDDGIDVLVDLAGHTRDNRLLVFARKPAPVSVSWLGFGYTTGLSAVDYFLTDEATLPPEHEAYFSEAPWRLPRPAFAYRPAPGMGEVGPLPALATGQVTFGSLTRSVRINHRTVRVWAQILQRLPQARLVVDSRDFRSPEMRQHVLALFGAQGIGPDRVTLGHHSPPWDVLRGMDIGLDCFPHNSGTTLFESLYMGVPFITLASRPGVGRLGGAILHGVGQPQWSADSEAEYVELAVQLAGDLPRLALIRQGLRQRLLDSPLMDETGFARAVEAAYRQMLARQPQA